MINNLYYGSDNADIDRFRNASFKFDTDVLATFLRRIYNGFDTSNDVEPTMWREILRIINEATVDGLVQGNYDTNIDKTFLEKLAHSNEVFSAFKVHNMGVDMAKKMRTDDGKLKPFSEWKKDIKSIASHYCGAWLQTEYSTATLRAKFAAEWKQYEADADIMPNLRWMPTTSANPEEEHKAYWMNRLTLPVGDRFWDKHHPGDHWNCKCSLEQTDEPANPDVLSHIPDVKAQKGLAANPGKTGEMFDDSHPYIADAPKTEAKAVNEIVQEFDTFTPAKSIEEAEEFASKFLSPKNALGVRTKTVVSFKGIDLEAANEVNRALERISKRIDLPMMSQIKTLPGTSKQFSSSDAIACYSTGDACIYLNKNILKSMKAYEEYKRKSNEAMEYLTKPDVYSRLTPSQKELVDTYVKAGRDLVGKSISDAVTHEFGHHVERSMQFSLNRDKEYREATADFKEKGVKISGYATTTRDEYFAESFNSWMIGEKVVDPKMVKIFESLKVKD